jgi:polygalacturonase
MSKTQLEDSMKPGSQFTRSRRAFLQTSLGTGAATLLARSPLARAAPSSEETFAWQVTAPLIRSRIQAPVFPQRDFDITSFGAVGDGVTDCTAAINGAIQACNAAGGGRVVVPSGKFFTGAITLLSNVNLNLPNLDSILLFSTDPHKYPNVLTRWEGNDLYNYSPLVYAFRQTNIAVTGKGTLDGQAGTFPNAQGNPSAWWWWKGSAPFGGPNIFPNQIADSTQLKQQGAVPGHVPVSQRVYGIEPNGTQHYLRPPLIGPYGCDNVLIEGVTVTRSPFWQMHLLFCRNVTIRYVTASSLGTNNDGCDPESCTDVAIEFCNFNTGDDCIAVKAGRGFDGMVDSGLQALGALPPWVSYPTTCQNVIISQCIMQSGHGGVTLGSEMSGGVNNTFVQNTKMLSNTLDIALRFKTNTWRGGFMTNYYARNIFVPNGVSATNGVITIDYFYSADATDRPQDAGPFRPFTDKIYVSNLIVPGGSSRFAFNLRGFSPANTPLDPAHGSVTIDDAIGLVRVSDSTINGVTSPTDIVQSVDLHLSNVTRNGVLLPDQ